MRRTSGRRCLKRLRRGPRSTQCLEAQRCGPPGKKRREQKGCRQNAALFTTISRVGPQAQGCRWVPPSSVEKLSSMTLVPGAKKVGDCCMMPESCGCHRSSGVMGLIPRSSKWGKKCEFWETLFTVGLHLDSGINYLVEVCEPLSKERSDLELQAKAQSGIYSL